MNKKTFLRISIGLFSALVLIEGAGHWVAWKASQIDFPDSVRAEKKIIQSLKAENALLRKKIEALQPNGLYVMVDTSLSQLYLYKNRSAILKATVSCGSGMILIDPSGKREWRFETPRGEFTIQTKYEKPTWIKPDWAFIEEGKPIPKNIMERAEVGMLGDYALGFGNGYFIHGTLYTRLLGKNITHGCIRMGDQDLKMLYEAVPIGTRLVIF
jgi:L,D-transpeptidase YbiS